MPDGRPGTATHQWLTMSDGARLSATLYLPADAGPGDRTPCLLEGLPYRQHDLTSSYRPEYAELRDSYGYAVCRLDLRGTGASAGDATDEYPAQERRDLAEVIAWLAGQEWCTGRIGMFGTSYSGFNALQMAAERPPALGAVCAIYSSDDRYTDDVHYMGGLLKWLDLVDYCHYMTPMNALPPTPELWATEGMQDMDWRKEWRRRFETYEPWLLTWMEHQRSDAYWAQGSIRPGYDRIACPTMIVAGWADGYRNNSFRTVEALAAAGVPHRLLAGPWGHMAPASALPGPRIDLVREMARWWDRHLRGMDDGVGAEPVATWYVRESTRPAAALDTIQGHWRTDHWPPESLATQSFSLDGRAPYLVRPDIGTAAWISCAGHLPYGQSLDQRGDDDRSLVWDLAVAGPEGLEIAGHPCLRLRVISSAPVATVAARLCDVFPDGTSALVTRGTLNLTRRGGMATAEALVPGQEYDVELELEATAWRWRPGQRVRLALAGADWPNTVAPPTPLTLTVVGGQLDLPVLRMDSTYAPATFAPGGDAPADEGEGVTWTVTDDVLGGRTRAEVDHGSEYGTPFGSAREHYTGMVEVDRATFAQRATARVELGLSFAEARVAVTSDLDVTADADSFTVRIELHALEDDRPTMHRSWTRTYPRDLA
ncbi:MAG: CocE/NonD family hydrolase [Actinomycetales bacterium]